MPVRRQPPTRWSQLAAENRLDDATFRDKPDRSSTSTMLTKTMFPGAESTVPRIDEAEVICWR